MVIADSALCMTADNKKRNSQTPTPCDGENEDLPPGAAIGTEANATLRSKVNIPRLNRADRDNRARAEDPNGLLCLTLTSTDPCTAPMRDSERWRRATELWNCLSALCLKGSTCKHHTASKQATSNRVFIPKFCAASATRKENRENGREARPPSLSMKCL